MKKLFVLVLSALLILSACALAGSSSEFPEGYDVMDSMQSTLPEGALEAPAAKNPQDHPDYAPFDGFSDEELESIYEAMDMVNDEAYVVDKYGSMTCTCDFVDADGNTYEVNASTLLKTDFGLMTVSTNESLPGMTFYQLPNRTVIRAEEEYSLFGALCDSDTQEQVWHNFHFPYMPFDHLRALRGTPDSGYFVLAESTQGCLYEYATDAGLHILEIRRYVPDDNGDFIYNGHCTYSAGKYELPGEVAALLSEGEAPAAGNDAGAETGEGPAPLPDNGSRT